jgi:iron complex transport system substrate-binding protein
MPSDLHRNHIVIAWYLLLLITILTMDTALAAPAQRVVTLSPHTTELVYFAGGGDRLVGISNFSDFPPSVTTLPRIGDAMGMDRERILMLKPDLVVVWSGGARYRDLQWLRQQHIRVYESDPQTLQAIARDILALGKLLATEQHAQRSVRDFNRQLQQLRALGQNSLSGQRVIHQLWQHPLMVLTDEELVSRALALCGITNPVHITGHKLATVTNEFLWSLDADAILIDQKSFFDAYNPSSMRVIHADTLRLHRPTPRLLDAALEVCLEIIQTTEQ